MNQPGASGASLGHHLFRDRVTTHEVRKMKKNAIVVDATAFFEMI
jgi:hypothetical protein